MFEFLFNEDFDSLTEDETALDEEMDSLMDEIFDEGCGKGKKEACKEESEFNEDVAFTDDPFLFDGLSEEMESMTDDIDFGLEEDTDDFNFDNFF